MKIQLFLAEHQNLLTPFEDCQAININQLDSIPNSTCTLIHIGNCYDFIPNNKEVLTKAISKLRYGGQLVIEGTDLIEVSYGISRDMIQTQDVQGLLFAGRHTCSTIHEMTARLRQCGLTILMISSIIRPFL